MIKLIALGDTIAIFVHPRYKRGRLLFMHRPPELVQDLNSHIMTYSLLGICINNEVYLLKAIQSLFSCILVTNEDDYFLCIVFLNLFQDLTLSIITCSLLSICINNEV